MRVLLLSGVILSLRAAALPAQTTQATFEQGLRMGVIDEGYLAARIPGYAEIVWNMPQSCSYTVYLTDLATQAAQARAVLAPLAERCPSDPQIRVAKSYFSRRDYDRLQQHVSRLLREAGEPNRGMGLRRGRVYVNTLNPRQRDRVAALLSRHESELPVAHIDLNLPGPPYELDGPIHMPGQAYLAIADSLPSRAIVDTSGLSAIAAAAFRTRDFRLTAGECGSHFFRFGQPRGFDDDRYVIDVFELPAGLTPQMMSLLSVRLYEIQCASGTCHIKWSGAEEGDWMGGCRAPRSRP